MNLNLIVKNNKLYYLVSLWPNILARVPSPSILSAAFVEDLRLKKQQRKVKKLTSRTGTISKLSYNFFEREKLLKK